jgi:hypothetical protein
VAPVVGKLLLAFLKTKMLMSHKKYDILVLRQGVTPVVLGYIKLPFDADYNNPGVQVPAGMLKMSLVQKLAA